MVKRIVSFIVVLVLIAGIQMSITHAQDAAQPIVCRDVDYGYGSFVIRIPPEWNNPDLASWWVLADGFGAYAEPADGVTFRADALTRVDVYGEGNPQWEQDLKVGDVVVGSGDYSVIVVANQNTPECDSNDYPVIAPTTTPAPIPEPVAQSQAVASTGRSCVAKYLESQVVIVCS